MSSAIWLLKDSYKNFVSPQDIDIRMRKSQWRELQKLVKWADLSIDEIHGVLVFLVTRSLGKVKALATQFDCSLQTPEALVLHVMERHETLVPSILGLSDDMLSMVKGSLLLHSKFNLMQMVQGENTPSNIMCLQTTVGLHDEKKFKFYLVSAFASMCGLYANRASSGRSSSVDSNFSAGSDIIGSRFMDGNRASIILLCTHALQALGTKSPSDIYLTYIKARGRLHKLPMESREEIAFARLACLNRIENKWQLKVLAEAWGFVALSYVVPEQCSERSEHVPNVHIFLNNIQVRTFQTVVLGTRYKVQGTRCTVPTRYTVHGPSVPVRN